MLEKTGKSDSLLASLRIAFSKPIWKLQVQDYAKQYGDQPDAMATLLDLALGTDNEIGFRASWILETACIANKHRLLPILAPLISRFPEQKNVSAQRHFGKLVYLFAHQKAPAEISAHVAQLDLSPAMSTLFEWLVSTNTPVAVKANALEALAMLIPREPWIAEELLETVNFLADKESPAFFARAKRVRPLILKNQRLQGQDRVGRILP